MSRPPALVAITILFLLAVAGADQEKAAKAAAGQPITSAQRIDIIRALNGELVFARKPFPLGVKGIEITPQGKVTPDEVELEKLVAINGPAVKPGERARITDLIIKDKAIIFEINGGPVKKRKWWQRISVGGAGGTTPVTPQPDELARGSYVAVVFDKYVPQITPQELKERLAPVLDFTSKSSAEAYLDSLPPKAKAAIQDHQVLVGMSKDMVLAAIGKPPRKHREKDGTAEYEEWIYGDPPQEVKFVRFVGDEVTRLEIMTVDGQKIIRTDREIDLRQAVADQPAAPAPKPASAPTLRRPDEQPEGSGRTADRPGPVQPGQQIPQPNAPPMGAPPPPERPPR